MRPKHAILLLLLLPLCAPAIAQKPFTEGTIVYRIRLESPDHKLYSGMYTFTFKGAQIKKELKLDNGYQDEELLNCAANTIYSLRTMNGKKYAIQLSMSEQLKAQQPFAGFSMSNEQGNSRNIAGYAANKCSLSYKNGAATEVYYTREWRPAQPVTFERFPDAHFLPLTYTYTDKHGITMRFEAEKVTASPVESAIFRIPADYKMISNEEYVQMSK